jgi:hypothetical protein
VRRFDGSDDSFGIAALEILRNVPGATSFAVRKLNENRSDVIFIASVSGGSLARFFFGQGGDSNNNYITGVRRNDGDTGTFANNSNPKTNTSFVIQTARVNYLNGGTNAVQTFANGSVAASTNLSGTGNTANTNSQAVRVGSNAAADNLFFNGDIAEILIFPTALSTEDRQKVEQYLSSKYAIALA